MTSTYTGIFLRDSVGQTPNTAAPTWNSSPDVIPYSVQPFQFSWFAYFVSTQAGEIAKRYDRDFALEAAYTFQNYVYVRGLGYKNGTVISTDPGTQGQKARIYLFYCAPSDFHLPAKWVATGIQAVDPVLGPTGKAYAEVQVQQYNAVGGVSGVGAIGQFTWTPPTLPQGSDPYRLIAYVQNNDSDFSPSTLPADLGSGAALTTWVENTPNIAVYDTDPTEGIFVRDFDAQESYQSSSNNLSSPDIGMNGLSPMAPSAVSGFGTDLPHAAFTPNTWNYVYVRGKSKAASQTSRLYLYYVRTSVMGIPQGFQSDNIIVNGQRQNHVEVTATNIGDPVSADFLWNPPPLTSGETYTLVVWTQNQLLSSQSFDPANNLPGLGTDAATVGASVAGYYSLAAVTALAQDASSTQPTEQGVVQLATATNATTIWVGLQFTKMTGGGKFSISVDHLGGDTIVDYHADSLDGGNAVIMVPTSYAAGMTARLIYRFWSGGNQPAGATVVPVAYTVGQNGVLTPIAMTPLDTVMSFSIALARPKPSGGPGASAGPSLESIEGIGPQIAVKLRAAGIPDVTTLAGADPSRYTIPGVSQARFAKWRAMADILVNIARLNGNDAEVLVEGLGATSARDALQRLRATTAEQLSAKLPALTLPGNYSPERLLAVKSGSAAAQPPR